MYRFLTFSVTLAWIVVAVLHPRAQEERLRKAAIAHRGASAYAPEHTLAAYRLAVAQAAGCPLIGDGVNIQYSP